MIYKWVCAPKHGHKLLWEIDKVFVTGRIGTDWTEVLYRNGSMTDCPNEWLYDTREEAEKILKAKNDFGRTA